MPDEGHVRCLTFQVVAREKACRKTQTVTWEWLVHAFREGSPSEIGALAVHEAVTGHRSWRTKL
jgi:hypothetical protein